MFDIVNLINLNFTVFAVQRRQNLKIHIFDIYLLLSTLGSVQIQVVHICLLFFFTVYLSKTFLPLGAEF